VISHSDFIVIKIRLPPEWMITMARTVDHDGHYGDHDRSPLAFLALDLSQ